MGHSKSSLLEDIKKKGGEIIACLLFEGIKIKPEHFQVPDDASSFRMDFIRPAWSWLCAIYDGEYAAVQRIKNLQTPEMWTRYKTWGGFEDHREVVLLHDALVTLRAKVVSRARPDFLKPSKRKKTKARIKAKSHQ